MATKITKFTPELAPRDPDADDGLAATPTGPRLSQKQEQELFNNKRQHAERAKALGISVARLDALEYAAEIASKLRAGDRHFILQTMRSDYDTHVDANRDGRSEWIDVPGGLDKDFDTPKFAELLSRPASQRRDELINRLDAHAALVLGNRFGHIARVPQGRFDPDIWVNISLLFCPVEKLARDEEGPLLMPLDEHKWLCGNGKKPEDNRKLWWTRAWEKRAKARSERPQASAQADFARHAAASIIAPKVAPNDVEVVQNEEADELDAMNAGLNDMLIGLIKTKPNEAPEPTAESLLKPDPQAFVDHATEVLTQLQTKQQDEVQPESLELIGLDANTPQVTTFDDDTTEVTTEEPGQIEVESTSIQNDEDDPFLALFIDSNTDTENQSQAI